MGSAQHKERVETYIDCNVGVFGLLRPKRFTGVATQKVVSEEIAKILNTYSYPSFNTVFSAGGRLLFPKTKSTKVGGRVRRMEARIRLLPLDAKGKPVKDVGAKSEGPPLIKVLALEPSSTRTIKVVDGRKAPSDADLWSALPPLISSGIQGVGGLIGVPVPKEVAKSLGTLGAVGLQAAFGDDESRPSYHTVERASIGAVNEFSWLFESRAEERKDGVYNTTAFLQVSREVRKLEVHARLGVDWVDELENTREKQKIVLDVIHPKKPQTPTITDFRHPNQLPLMIPIHDVGKLLGLEVEEVKPLIESEGLKAFGSDDSLSFTKGSVLKLLGLMK